MTDASDSSMRSFRSTAFVMVKLKHAFFDLKELHVWHIDFEETNHRLIHISEEDLCLVRLSVGSSPCTGDLNILLCFKNGKFEANHTFRFSN